MIRFNDESIMVDPIDVCKEMFGDFKEFHKFFMDLKFGGLPTKTHPTPNSISKIRKLEQWPKNYRLLRHMSSICYVCENKGVLKHCKCSLKAMVGECEGLFMEATKEDSRLRAKNRDKQEKQKGRK